MKHILLAVALLTTLASCTMPGSTPSPVAPTQHMTPDAMMQKDTMPKDTMTMSGSMEHSGSWTKAEMEAMEKDHMMMSGTVMANGNMMNHGDTKPSTGYTTYDAATVAGALASGQKVILFFHATWCPTCKALNEAINAEVTKIPQNTLIVQVDYDSSAELKQKYGVTTQHTLITLNPDGSVASKKIGSRDLAEVLK